MVIIKNPILALATCCSAITIAHGQSTNPATGGNANGAEGTVSYSIGQASYHTCSDENKSVARGVQQPYEISVVTATENTDGILHTLDVFSQTIIRQSRSQGF